MIKSVFILAAGRGERLGPLTDKTPKPLLQVNGKPLLEHVLTKLSDLELERVVINVWYLGEMIEDYVRQHRNKFNFEIHISHEEELLGTGGGLKKALPLIGQAPFLLLNSDSLWEGDLQSFLSTAAKTDQQEATWLLASERANQTKVGVCQHEICQLGNLWSDTKRNVERYGCFTGIQIIHKMDANGLPDKGCLVRDYWISRLRKSAQIGAVFDVLTRWDDLGTPEILKSYQKK